VLKKIIGHWVTNEDGFEVFEKFGLTQGGVLLALGVTAVGIYFMGNLWNGVSKSMDANGLGAMSPATAASSPWINQ